MPIRKGFSLQAGPEQEVPLSDHDSNDWSNHQRPDFGELQDLAFSKRLVAAGERHLLASIFDDVDDGGLLISREVQLGTLQRMVLHDLQRQLLQIVRDIHGSKNATPGLMSSASLALAKYCSAVRDYDFIKQKFEETSSNGGIDPFRITTDSGLGFYLFKDAHLLGGLSNDEVRRLKRREAFRQDKRDYNATVAKNILPDQSRREQSAMIGFNKFLERFSMGVLGGFALIGPMLIMVLHKDTITTLLTSSVATLLFAGGLAIAGKDLKGETVLASVAAYAAVMVVFVGAGDSK